MAEAGPDGSQASDKPLAPGLYLVATPIGNLEDMTLRGLRVLRQVDRIACEDTRQTAKLLGHFGIRTPTVSYHMHNEGSRATELMETLKAGGRIAVVSDAGTPGIADPGAMIAAEAIAAGVAVYPVPGANAALSALVASGFSAESFTFHGFLPSKEGQRRSVLEALKASSSGGRVTAVFYETPHRIVDALADVAAILGSSQRVVLARELTKLHEEFLRGTAGEVLAVLRARASVRGEMVLLLEMSEEVTQPALLATLGEEVATLMAGEGLSEKDALKRVAKARGMGKSEAYRSGSAAESGGGKLLRNSQYLTAAMLIQTTDIFDTWLLKLRDDAARGIIGRRVMRLSQGNPGQIRGVGDSVLEMKIDFGPGYRVYYIQRGADLIVLLCGGDKSTQDKDIEKAKRLAGRLQ